VHGSGKNFLRGFSVEAFGERKKIKGLRHLERAENGKIIAGRWTKDKISSQEES
jgi:hypothetical protein